MKHAEVIVLRGVTNDEKTVAFYVLVKWVFLK